MVNFDLTDEQQMLQELARDFANEEIKPNAAQWDKESVYPKEAIAKSSVVIFSSSISTSSKSS